MTDSTYTNTLPYSLNKKDWFSTLQIITRLKELDDLPLTKKDREKALELLEGEFKSEAKKVRKAYLDEEDRILLAFKVQQVSDFKLDRFSQATQDKLFNLAWELGHSYGYSEVHNHYYDLVDLLETTLY